MMTQRLASPGIAQDLGREDIAVQLLEHQDENDEFQALDRIDEEDQHRTGDRAQEGPKKGIMFVTPSSTASSGA